jgi:molybdopterin synthase sulfur carrier subunit
LDVWPIVEVTLPQALAALFPGCPRQAYVQALTVGDAIAALNRSWPGLRDRLCDDSPGLRRHIRIFVRGDLAKLETELSGGDEVFVVTAISGG